MKKIITSTFCIVTLLSVSSGVIAQAESISFEDNLSTSIINSDDNTKNIDVSNSQQRATLTRYWTRGWIKEGNPAPSVAYFRNGAYHGYLSKVREMPVKYGTRGFYEGYFYHYSLPLPIPASLNLDNLDNDFFDQ